MNKSSKLNWRSRRIHKIYQKIIKVIVLLFCSFMGFLQISVYYFLILYLIFALCRYLHIELWIGQPSQITCQDIDLIRVDCTLNYQALLRSSEQKVKDIQGIDVDTRTYSSENINTTKFVAILRSKNGDGQSPAFGDREIKTYSCCNDPELEVLNHRLNQFVRNPQEKLVLTVQYSWWKSAISSFFVCVLIFILMLTVCCIFWIIKSFLKQFYLCVNELNNI
ncbi:MAG: hypothetical protein AB3A66_05045 [Nodularia sp. CChRGM 3473]